MLTQADRLFLLLLRIAMRGEQPDPTPFLGLKESVWRRIRHLARAHAVAGFVGDTILKLPKEALPPRQLYLKIFTEVEMTKEGNRRLLAGLKDLMTKLEEVELPFVLLKGLGISQYYPKPELRAGGDLDLLYYSETDYLWANVFLMQEGYHLHVESEARRGHTAFSYRSTLVENHARAVFFDLKRHNAYFEQLVDAAIREGRLERVSLGEGVEVDTLPAELNALYIWRHTAPSWIMAASPRWRSSWISSTRCSSLPRLRSVTWEQPPSSSPSRSLRRTTRIARMSCRMCCVGGTSASASALSPPPTSGCPTGAS